MMESRLSLARRTSSWIRTQKESERCKRFQTRVQLRAMLSASRTCSCQAMEGQTQGEQAFLQRMANLAEAATSAGSPAERALSQIAAAGATSSSSSSHSNQAGLAMAAHVLKNPDCFRGDPHSFAAWKFGFCSWLSFGDPRFQSGLDAVENLNSSQDIKPYSVVTSYLRGRCVGLVRSLAKTRDG